MCSSSPTTHRRALPFLRWNWLALALMVAAQFMTILDSSIVNVALPTIQHELGFSRIGVQAVVTAYNTAFGGALILGGRIADLLGRRRVFVAGMAAFAATSLVCGLAGNAASLVAARALQGLAAAVVAPAALSLLTTTFPEGPRRNRALSVFGVATVLGFVGGLLLGGALVGWLGWRSVFLVNVPVGAAVAALAPRLLAAAPPRRVPLDVSGAALVTAAMALIVLAPTRGAALGWTSPQCWLPLLGALGLLAAFVRVERRSPAPLVRLEVLRGAPLRVGNAVTFTLGAANGAVHLLFSMYLQQVLGYTPLQAGLAAAPMGVASLVAGLLAGRLAGRVGLRATIATATAAAALCIWLLASATAVDQRYPVLLPIIVPLSVAFIVTSVSATIAATTGVADAEQGLAGGLRQTSFQLGIAIGVALLLSIAAGGAGAATRPAALVAGFQLALRVLAALMAATSAAALVGLRGAAAGAAAPAAR